MEECVFTDMRNEDLPVVLDIYNHYIATTTATFDPAPVPMQTLKNRILIGHDLYKSYVIRLADEIAGFCFLCQFRKHESYDRTAELGIYLKPEHTRRGLGARAVEHLEHAAAARGFKVLIASISGENIASIAFFRSLEWEQCAHFRQVAQKWGRTIDLVFFQKVIE